MATARIAAAIAAFAGAVIIVLYLLPGEAAGQQQDRAGLDARVISQAAGTEAKEADDGVVRIGWQRTDVPVNVDRRPLPTPAGLGSWAAFKPMPHGVAMVMGDTVVFEDEITPAMDAAFANGLEVTALHNHFIFDRPPVYFMHIGGTGEPQKLAEGVRAVWNAIKQVRAERPQPSDSFGGETPAHTGEFDVAALKKIFVGKENEGGEPSVSDGVVKFTFAREATMHGMSFGGSMGLSTWAAFTGSQDHAAVDGDFAMTADEVQAVMHALRDANIHIVALHNHMIGEEPAYFFLHYWGTGPAEQLARGVRGALDAQQRATDER